MIPRPGTGLAGPDRRRRRLVAAAASLVVLLLALLVPRLVAPRDGAAPRLSWDDLPGTAAPVLDLLSPAAGPMLLSAVGDGGFLHPGPAEPPVAFGGASPTGTEALDAAGRRGRFVARVGLAGPDGPGIAFSADAGLTWFPALLQPGWVSGGGAVAVGADGLGVLWAPPAQDAAVSADFGRSWERVRGLPQGAPVAADRSRPDVYYAVAGGRFLVSDDGGRTFRTTRAGLPTGPVRVTAAPDRAGHVWVATGAGLWRTTDGGTTVERVPGLDAAGDVQVAAAPSGDAARVYALGRQGGLAGLWVSVDGGKDWTRADDGDPRMAGASALAVDPRDPGRVYVGLRGGGIRLGREIGEGVRLRAVPAPTAEPPGPQAASPTTVTGTDTGTADAPGTGTTPPTGPTAPATGPTGSVTGPPGPSAGGSRPAAPGSGPGGPPAPGTPGSPGPTTPPRPSGPDDPAPTPGSTPPPPAPSTPTARPAVSCRVAYAVRDKWENGFSGEVTVTSTGPDPVSGWTLRWTYRPGQALTEVSGATLRNGGPEVVLGEAPGAAPLAPGEGRTITFVAVRPPGPNHPPEGFRLDGAACTRV